VILARGALGRAKPDERQLVLRRLPERRTLLFGRYRSGLCVANLHASGISARAEEEVRRAAEVAIRWAGGLPFVLGGDFNLRPDRSEVFDELERRFGFRAPTAPESIDHLLARDLSIVDPPASWAPEAREIADDGRALRLSDHAPVAARFRFDTAASRRGRSCEMLRKKG
jgi:endonuclease/exonuclease/phosphatase family metal-dependent hydrolase